MGGEGPLLQTLSSPLRTRGLPDALLGCHSGDQQSALAGNSGISQDAGLSVLKPGRSEPTGTTGHPTCHQLGTRDQHCVFNKYWLSTSNAPGTLPDSWEAGSVQSRCKLALQGLHSSWGDNKPTKEVCCITYQEVIRAVVKNKTGKED